MIVDGDGRYLSGAPINIPDDATSLSISQNGQISYTQAGNPVVGDVIQLYKFNNPSGLEKSGGNLYRESLNSGEALEGAPGGDGGQGLIKSGSLEMSNVDLSEEFTEMIVAQRGFQANTRIITTSDEILQELVNLKR